MAENRRKGSRMPPEQLQLIDLQAQLGGEEMAVFVEVGTRLLMRMLAPRTDPAMEALIKSHEHTMMVGFASLGKSLKEAIRDVMRETVRIESPATPLATSPVLDEAVPTPAPRGRPRRGRPESWDPTISKQVRTDIDAAAGGMQNRDTFVIEAIEQFRPVMQKGVRNRNAIITRFHAQLFQPEVGRSRMTLHIRVRWRRQVTTWAKRLNRQLEPNQLLEVILRWRLNQIQEAHGRPSGAQDAPVMSQGRRS
jgi:hypothetical protein